MDFSTNFKSFISYFKRVVIISVLAVFCMSEICKAEDGNDDVFFVNDVDIYAESDNLENAKNEAYNSGTKQAFSKLMERMLPKEQWWKVNDITKQKAHLALKETYVIHERMTSHSYRGKIAFQFNEVEVKKILQRAGTFYYDKYSVPHLLIPVIKKENDFLIWQDTNWNSAWDDRPSRIGLFSYVYLMDDINDVDLLKKPDSFLQMRLYKFVPILERYGAEGIVLVIGETIEDKLKLTIRIASRNSDTIRTFSYDRDPNIDDEEFYKNVASDALQKIDSIYKGYDFIGLEKLYETEFNFAFENRKQWQDLKFAISRISEIRKFEVLDQDKVSAKFKITYNTDPTLMGKILYNNNINIVDNKGILSVTHDKE